MNFSQNMLNSSGPQLDRLTPHAAIPGASFEIFGAHLLATSEGPAYPELPAAFFGETAATLDLARPTRALVRVPEGAISSELTLRHGQLTSNPLFANVGIPMVEDLHVISNPAVDASGSLFAMCSGPRGQAVPVSIFRIARDLQVTPFARDLMNVSALAFDYDGSLYASSRSEGTIYRITPAGVVHTYAEGMGIATGLAFDQGGNLYVGDRSGTIFKLAPPRHTGDPAEIFVFATLEPSVSFYHLCFRGDGHLLVTAPTTSSQQPIWAIDPDGNKRILFNGLGRPQGMALDTDGNLYVAASLQGNRGIIRVAPSLTTNELAAERVVAGNDLVGLCFLDDGCAALATNSTLFHTDMGVEGRPLI